jgi:hypothetical protein
MIILNEETQETEVLKALQTFIETANSSTESFTLQDLQEMVKTQVFIEAGGLISWYARRMTGKDKDLPGAIEEELKTIKSEEQKQKLLKDTKKFIEEAEAVIKNADPTTALEKIKSVLNYSPVKSFFTDKNRKDGTLEKYLNGLKSVCAKVEAYKIDK